MSFILYKHLYANNFFLCYWSAWTWYANFVDEREQLPVPAFSANGIYIVNGKKMQCYKVSERQEKRKS